MVIKEAIDHDCGQLLPLARHQRAHGISTISYLRNIRLLLLVGSLALLLTVATPHSRGTTQHSVKWAIKPSSLCSHHIAPISTSEFASRHERLSAVLRTGNDSPDFQGVYITEPGPNMAYYLNISSADWWLSERAFVVAVSSYANRTRATILTPSFELSRARQLPIPQGLAVDFVTWEETDDPYNVLLNNIVGKNVKQLQVQVAEDARFLVAEGIQRAINTKPQFVTGEVVFVSHEVRALRMRKTAAEIEIQRCAGNVTIEAIRAVRKSLVLGMSEKTVETMIDNALKEAGLVEIDLIALFGENAALPHASASEDRILKEGDMVLLDVGGRLHGYYSDVTRTILRDKPTGLSLAPSADIFESAIREWLNNWIDHSGLFAKQEQTWPSARAKEVWTTVSLAQKAALDRLSVPSGTVSAAAVDLAARGVIEKAGYGPKFTHRLGHGIGLEVHEAPYLNKGAVNTMMESGFTHSCEPGIYIEKDDDPMGVGIGVRLEDMVLKTETGFSLLSTEVARSPWEP